MADWRARSGFSALALAGLAALGGLVYLAARPRWQPAPAAAPAAPVLAAPAPQFDVARVDAGGNAVIAGHGAPGATVTISRNGRRLGTVTLDAAGSFAYLPDGPLPPGAQLLTMIERLPDGTVIAGPQSATLMVPARPSQPSLAVLSGPGGSEVLSPGGPRPGTLGIGTVDYDAAGHAIFSGTAAAGTRVTVTLGGRAIGAATAGADGRWRLSGRVPTASGTITARAPSGATASAPFALETLPTALAAGHVVIAPGQNLWLIARAAYGHGNLYTLIYQANAGAIHDPDLIFPGQAFAVPKSAASAAP